MSQHTAYQRFFIIMKRLPLDWARYFANVDYCRRMALVAERALDWRPELIGVARYEPSDEKDTTEVALVVQDYWQGQGLGSLLLREILRAGEANGIRAFRAHVLADNHRSTTGCLLAPSRQCSVWPPSQSPVPALGFTHVNAVT